MTSKMSMHLIPLSRKESIEYIELYFSPAVRDFALHFVHSPTPWRVGRGESGVIPRDMLFVSTEPIGQVWFRLQFDSFTQIDLASNASITKIVVLLDGFNGSYKWNDLKNYDSDETGFVEQTGSTIKRWISNHFSTINSDLGFLALNLTWASEFEED